MLADLSIEKQNLEKELQMHQNERQNLHTDLFTAKSEIKSLKDELNNLKIQLQNQNHQTSEKSYQNQMQKQKLDESTNLNYSYLNEISVFLSMKNCSTDFHFSKSTAKQQAITRTRIISATLTLQGASAYFCLQVLQMTSVLAQLHSEWQPRLPVK